jgi:CRP/FNR family transcriptional regulator, nitrogen oxide reductase regulator
MSVDRAFLGRVRLFEGLEDDALDDVLSAATPRRVPAGFALFEQGEAPRALSLVTQGRVKVGHLSPDGRPLTVAFLGPGEIAGCAAVFRRIPYPATPTAVVDTTVAAWATPQIEALMERHPRLATNALRIMGGRAEAMLHRLQEMTTESAGQRIARALLRLAREAGRSVEAGVQVDFALSRQDLAELSGATLYTVSRTLRAWERSGVVRIGRQRVIVRDLNGLARLAETP